MDKLRRNKMRGGAYRYAPSPTLCYYNLKLYNTNYFWVQRYNLLWEFTNFLEKKTNDLSP